MIGNTGFSLSMIARSALPAGCRPLVGAELDLPSLCSSSIVRTHVREAIARWNALHPESSTRVVRALLLEEPASIDAGEVTDKGYVNQRQTLRNRQDLVRLLYAQPAPPGVISAAK